MLVPGRSTTVTVPSAKNNQGIAGNDDALLTGYTFE
jgi:hypothetical protein